MRVFPILPIWLMTIICILLIFGVVKSYHEKKKIGKTTIINIAIIILLFIINLRIMIPSNKSLVAANNLDIIFVIDNSISMVADDYQSKTRLEGVKENCNYIIKDLNGARFSIITFDNNSKLIIPFTVDTSMATESIAIIKSKAEYRASGSSLNAPKTNLETVLKNSKEKEDRIRIIFFITDGENTLEEQPLESYDELAEYVDGGAVLGFGSLEGSTMYVGEEGTWGEYVMANFGQEKAISKLDESNLKKLASDLGIDYIHVEKEKDIQNKIKELKILANSSFQNSDKSTYDDIYYIFVIPLLLLLLFHFKDYKGVYK